MRRSTRSDSLPFRARTAAASSAAVTTGLVSWPPVHEAIPSAAPMLRRCRQCEPWGKVSPHAR